MQAVNKAVMRMRTKRRIVLTGTPLQNRLIEYHAILGFVYPGFLSTATQFRNRFQKPIENGQHANSTQNDVALMKRRVHVLVDRLKPVVHRRGIEVFSDDLPAKVEYVLSIRLTPLQRKLYLEFLRLRQSGEMASDFFKAWQTLLRVWNHPRVLYAAEKRRLRVLASKGGKLPKGKRGRLRGRNVLDPLFHDDDVDTATAEDEESDSEFDDEIEITIGGKKCVNAATSAAAEKVDGAVQENRAADSIADYSAAVAGGGGSGNNSGSGNVSSETARRPPPSPKRSPLKSSPLASTSIAAGGSDQPDKGGQTWWEGMLPEMQANRDNVLAATSESGKFLILSQIIWSLSSTDRIIIFSQSLSVLDLLEQWLQTPGSTTAPKCTPSDDGGSSVDGSSAAGCVADAPGATAAGGPAADPHAELLTSWKKGKDYLRIDGSTPASTRIQHCDRVNDPKDTVRAILISVRSGALGINLIGANRVILFDTSFNPSHDAQAIARAYRYGQTQTVTVYRLVSAGTMEEKVYKQQVEKQALFSRVVDEQQINRHFSKQEVAAYIALDDGGDDEPIDPDSIKDDLLANIMRADTGKARNVVRIHEHCTLLQNQPNEELTDAEKVAAWAEFKQLDRSVWHR